MDDVETLGGIYDYLIEDSYAPTNLDDLLRSKIVCSVSAFDKLMHDIIHAGIVAIYSGKRASTPKVFERTYCAASGRATGPC